MSDLAPALRVEILRALGSGRTPEAVAADLLVPVATVRALGERCGWPDADACAAAADGIDRAIAAKERARIARTPRTDPVMALLHHGRRSPRKRTRHLAERASQILVQLAAEVRREQSPGFLANSAAHRGTVVEVTGVDPETVRVWARENGLQCSDTGRLRKRVVDAYVAAHTEAGAA